MPDFPGKLIYHDILVVPYKSLYGASLHEGGPIWHDWEKPSPARFYREQTALDNRPTEVPAETQIDNPNAFWIGPLHRSFGHMMLEVVPRIAPTICANPAAELVFATCPGGPQTLAEAPAWMRELLAWHDVKPNRVRVIDRPARYTLLNVVPQPERAGFEDPPPPHEDYLDALTRRTRRNLGVPNPDGVLFVSRSGVRNELVGETYLDEVFARAGATIMHPETMSLVDQLRGYAEHEILIFSEGSAFHGFQQLGRHPGVGVILKRRPDVDFGHVVGPPRFRRFELLEATRARVVDRKPNGTPNSAAGLSFIDVPNLLQGMGSLGIDLAPYWDETRFRRAEAIHALRWMRNQGLPAIRIRPSQIPELAAAFHAAGMPGLIGHAMRLMNFATRLFTR